MLETERRAIRNRFTRLREQTEEHEHEKLLNAEHVRSQTSDGIEAETAPVLYKHT